MTSNDLRHTASQQTTWHKLFHLDTRTSKGCIISPRLFSGVIGSFTLTMAPKRKLERKTGVHTLGDTPPSKKTKTTRTTPKATGLHSLAGSETKSKAWSRKPAPKKGSHTLANVSVGHNSRVPVAVGRLTPLTTMMTATTSRMERHWTPTKMTSPLDRRPIRTVYRNRITPTRPANIRSIRRP